MGGEIAFEKFQFVLMTVQFQDHQISRIVQPIDSWEIAVAVIPQINSLIGVVFHIVNMNLHQRIVFSCFGIFIFVFLRI